MFDRIRIRLGPHEGPIGRLMYGGAPAGESAPADDPPGLGNRMRRDHARLIHAFRDVLDSHWRRDYVSCLAYLRRFEQQLQLYLAHDEALLEAWLAGPLDAQSERLETLRALRNRLRHLARQAREFAGLRPGDLHPPCRMDFGLAFLGMAKALRECLESREARLIPLYRAVARGT